MNFRKYTNCTTIKIGKKVNMINDSATEIFFTMRNLKNIDISDDVVDMYAMCYDCYNLTTAVCGPNVYGMYKAYANCYNLTEAVCSDSVINLCATYQNCYNLTKAACGNKVTTMYQAYNNCQNLTTPVCGPNVTTMYGAYQNCVNLTTAVCGPNVTNMANAYSRCIKITKAVCGPKVVDMSNAYQSCYNLTKAACGPLTPSMTNSYANCVNLKTAVCGPNVTYMGWTYYNCRNLTTAVCGDKVTEMYMTYGYCSNLTTAVCGPNVKWMQSAYTNCHNIRTAVCGPNVTNMQQTYINCINLTTAVCGDKVEGMCYTYENCRSLTTPVCGPNVTNMTGAYINCINLTTAVIGPKVNNMSQAYKNCSNITEPVFASKNAYMNGTVNTVEAYKNCISLTEVYVPEYVTSIGANMFNGCSNLSLISFADHTTMPSISPSSFTNVHPDCTILVDHSIFGDCINDTMWKLYSDKIIPVGMDGPFCIEKIKDSYITGFDRIINIDQIMVVNFDDTPIVNVTFENNIAQVDEIIINEPHPIKKTIDITLKDKGIEGITNVTVTITGDEGFVYTKTFMIDIRESTPSSYTILPIDGVVETFTLTDDGYYTNTNINKDSTMALCKIEISNYEGHQVQIECMQSSEYNFDYGLLSIVDTPLSASYGTDNSSLLQYSFKGDSSPSPKRINYGVINEGVIYVKYYKDGSASNGSDTFKFKVLFV